MIRFETDTTDAITRLPQHVPGGVNDFVARANDVLRDRLATIADENLTVVWHRFENHGSNGWSADVRLDLDGHSFSRQLWLDQVREPQNLKDTLREFVAEFGARLSLRAREDFRRLRGEIRELLRAGV